MPAQLLSLDDGPNILLDKPILLIGRHPECDILIDSRKISRRHCCIAQVGDKLIVRDLGSTNGIRINGVRVVEGRLKADDELMIGGHMYRVTWDLLPPSADDGDSVGDRSPMRPAAHQDPDEHLLSYDEPVPLAEPITPPGGRRNHVLPDHLGLADSDERESPESQWR
jgi:predicted component of type VI protein secretion system